MDGKECSKAQGEVWLLFKFCVERILNSHASGLQGLFSQSQNSAHNQEFMTPLWGLNGVLWAAREPSSISMKNYFYGKMCS